jgi:hypothetical protein
VAFLDSDDRWLPGHLKRIAAAAAAHPEAGLFYSDARVIDEGGRLLKLRQSPAPGPDPFRTLLLYNIITTSTAAVRKECLDAVGSFSTDLVVDTEDWDLWLRIAARFPIYHLGEALTDYRQHQDSITQTKALLLRGDGLTALRRALRDGPAQPKELVDAAYASIYLQSAIRFITAGQSGPARADLLLTLRHQPARLAAWPLMLATLLGDRACRTAVQFKRKFFSAE